MTKHWPKARWAGGGALVLALATALLLGPREPAYDGKSLSYWVTELKNTNPSCRQQAREALHAIGPQAVPFLLRMARNQGSTLKRRYREAWFRLPEAVRAHLGQPESEDAALSFISHALRQLGPDAGPALMQAMEDKNAAVRAAAGASFPYGHDSPMGVLWEIKLLQTADYDLKQAAAGILGTLGFKARPAAPALAEAAQHDETEYVRETAARSLAMLGREAASTALGLMNCLNDRSAAVRLWSAIALWRINHDCDAVPVLISDLKRASAEDGTCHAVIRALGEAGLVAKPAVPEIRRIIWQFDSVQVLPEGGAELIQVAREALLKIEPEADPADMQVP